MSWPTTRRFSRSLAEAFPDVRACAVEHYRPGGRLTLLADIAACALLAVLLAAGLVHWWA